MPDWSNEAELAMLLIVRGNEKRGVRLEPETALLIGRRLMQAQSKPSRNEIAKMICSGMRCTKPCYDCTAKANVIVSAYGERDPKLERPMPKDAGSGGGSD